ncbi:MAG: addiction module antitoxin [Planctomycetes bacterium]|nr:addiction module antitoxin [Planctomycetota bacterium]
MVAKQASRGVRRAMGAGSISRSVEGPVRPQVVRHGLAEAYREMAADKAREAEALEWCEGLLGDVADEER